MDAVTGAIHPGQAFGALTVRARLNYSPKQGATLWMCRCACGKEKTVSARNLRRGATRSCGCQAFRQRGITEQWSAERIEELRALAG